MSKSKRSSTTGGSRRDNRPDGRRQSQRRISVRAIRRTPPDVRKIGRAIIRMAVIEAEAERAAQADHTTEATNIPARGVSREPMDIDEVDHAQ